MKKGLIALFILSEVLATAQAQDSIRQLKPIRNFISGTSIAKKALAGAFRVVQQDYILTNAKGESFGRGGQEYFGRHYGIGVVAKNILWIEKQVLYPWLADKSYQILAAGKRLKPTQGKSYFAQYNYKPEHCNCDYKLAELVYDSIPKCSLAYYKLPEKTPSLEFHPKEIPSVGVMVIFYVVGNEPMSKKAVVKMSVTKQHITWNDARSKGEFKSIRLPGKTIGGAFFSENYNLGSLTYRLVALYTHKTKLPKEWELTAFQNEFTNKLTLIEDSDGGKKKKKKKRKKKRRRNRHN